MALESLPIPAHYNPETVGEIWRVPYGQRAQEAEQWALRHGIEPAGRDRFRICLLLVDVQNTFCIPGFELYVGGRSGTGAVEDNRRLCRFIYRHLSVLTEICATMDTHLAAQIFHPLFLLDADGNHPPPYTIVTVEDLEKGVWKFNESLASPLGLSPEYAQQHLLHYARELRRGGKYDLTVWPYHAMLGGIGHALVPAVEEAIFFHSVARNSSPDFQVKGDHPLTENYSVLQPEVTRGPGGESLLRHPLALTGKLLDFDAVVIAGQAKSHCVAWTVADLLEDVRRKDPALAARVYLLEDCTSPVVVPGIIDYTEEAEAAFQKFADSGMHLVRTGDAIWKWPGIRL